ncbi:MAG: TlpA family protein disulfide reductase [Bacteroidia bacterium]|nr:TlpA family protein disulfide reductase [Bacteroidia bacterium]MBT8268656.1 TlpA family protein disulfide reductase [Bacteroidia bacterium]NNF81457.1 TlpA family protein disulfide reductase [Flavobacteriaceae bacterium]NNK68904.1 TlpA family protein disulfide reductase [Flavobacteriaceae bacterium]NNL79117.1 TlpA family protein disulfide reductase [Flavobacteriaceae bacterium]
MKFLKLSLLLLCLYACKEEAGDAAQSDDLEVYDFNGLEPLLNQNDDKTYVVNFWATWCAPCIKELPYFEQLNRDYKEKNVEVLLVSLDFPRQYDKKLKPYIKDKNLQSRVVALNDPDMNTWIPKVNEDWTGAIPATIIYNSSGRKFYEKSFTYEELVNELRTFIEN